MEFTLRLTQSQKLYRRFDSHYFSTKSVDYSRLWKEYDKRSWDGWQMIQIRVHCRGSTQVIHLFNCHNSFSIII